MTVRVNTGGSQYEKLTVYTTSSDIGVNAKVVNVEVINTKEHLPANTEPTPGWLDATPDVYHKVRDSYVLGSFPKITAVERITVYDPDTRVTTYAYVGKGIQLPPGYSESNYREVLIRSIQISELTTGSHRYTQKQFESLSLNELLVLDVQMAVYAKRAEEARGTDPADQIPAPSITQVGATKHVKGTPDAPPTTEGGGGTPGTPPTPGGVTCTPGIVGTQGSQRPGIVGVPGGPGVPGVAGTLGTGTEGVAGTPGTCTGTIG